MYINYNENIPRWKMPWATFMSVSRAGLPETCQLIGRSRGLLPYYY